jgi:hypothetical protein
MGQSPVLKLSTVAMGGGRKRWGSHLGEADADARIDRPNATGEPRRRTNVEEQVLRHDTAIEP